MLPDVAIDCYTSFKYCNSMQSPRAETMDNLHVEEIAPTAANVTVRQGRTRDYLSEGEIEKLRKAAKGNRQGHRDATAILTRLSPWAARPMSWWRCAGTISTSRDKLHVRRSKGGSASVHPIEAKEIRALRAL